MASLGAVVVAALVGLGLVAGLALGGGWERTDVGADDVLERKAARQAAELRHARKELRASEQELRRVTRRARSRRGRAERLGQRSRNLERRNRELRRALVRALE